MTPDPRPPAADGERDLPEEIDRAIEAYDASVRGMDFHVYRGTREGCAKAKAECRAARAALTASILSRLTAAEAGREEARADQKAAEDQNDALHVKLKALAPHGSCACSYDHPGDTCMHHSPALVAALARVDKLERALAGARMQLEYWAARHPENDPTARVMGRINAALTEAQPKGEQ